MGDLISRKALIEKHCAENCGCVRSECGFSYEEDGCEACSFVSELEAAPTIEAEPVVRCKDCDYNEPCPAPDGFVHCSRTGTVVKEDDFCSYGWRA